MRALPWTRAATNKPHGRGEWRQRRVLPPERHEKGRELFSGQGPPSVSNVGPASLLTPRQSHRYGESELSRHSSVTPISRCQYQAGQQGALFLKEEAQRWMLVTSLRVVCSGEDASDPRLSGATSIFSLLISCCCRGVKEEKR